MAGLLVVWLLDSRTGASTHRVRRKLWGVCPYRSYDFRQNIARIVIASDRLPKEESATSPKWAPRDDDFVILA